MSKKTCELIIESGNDYVIAVKGNQPKLSQHILAIARNQTPNSCHVQIEKTRDRVTRRTVSVFHDFVEVTSGWMGIKSMIKIERVGTRAGKNYQEIVCYVSSLVRSAAEFAVGIRQHWGIENRLHWVKDVVFKEDKSRIRTGDAPANFSIVRAIAINILRSNGDDSITTHQRFLSHDIDKLLRLVE